MTQLDSILAHAGDAICASAEADRREREPGEHFKENKPLARKRLHTHTSHFTRAKSAPILRITHVFLGDVGNPFVRVKRKQKNRLMQPKELSKV